MMPDLGKYAVEVGLAYAVSIALLGGIIWLSWRQAVKQKRALDAVEARKNG
uniref:heme exporter protein CcmD n=1 Tax=Yoonia sp. TaxID=2212373 RepID=UPI004047F1CC|tara:strand:- start:30 stop:182 length:153 start_codon:yes stop_codon:yes gene_type:complete